MTILSALAGDDGGPVERLRVFANELAARGAWRELCAALSCDESSASARTELIVLCAEAYLRTGRSRDARDWLERSAPLIEQRGDRHFLRRAANLLGAARFDLGELDGARDAFERALELGREDDDDLLVARVTNNLGAIADIRGLRERALTMYGLAVVAYQRLADARGLAETYHNMAISYRHLGQLDRAEDHERHAIEFARQAGSARLLALARMGRAEITLARGDAVLAEATAIRVADEFAGLSEPIQQAGALRLVGAARIAQNRLDAARNALDYALAIARLNGSALDEAEILRTSAMERFARNDLISARAEAEQAIAIFERLDAREDRDGIVLWLAENVAAHKTLAGG
jgi:tetratricopeptide (TPR) repeat protein